MTGQVGEQRAPNQRQSPETLEKRVRELEDHVVTLTEAVRVLAHELENLSSPGPGGQQPAKAARHAYDLLLASGFTPKRAS